MDSFFEPKNSDGRNADADRSHPNSTGSELIQYNTNSHHDHDLAAGEEIPLASTKVEEGLPEQMAKNRDALARKDDCRELEDSLFKFVRSMTLFSLMLENECSYVQDADPPRERPNTRPRRPVTAPADDLPRNKDPGNEPEGCCKCCIVQ